ncbi:hypothetical protein [Roseiconus lacunae]|nr:hypothetical protein [Roseiconus lacunae]
MEIDDAEGSRSLGQVDRILEKADAADTNRRLAKHQKDEEDMKESVCQP